MILVKITGTITPILGTLINKVNWRFSFIISAIASFICIILLIFYTNVPDKNNSQKTDFLGSLILFGAIVTFDIGITIISYELYIVTGVLLLACAALCYVFVRVERVVPNPIFPLKLLKPPVAQTVVISIVMAFCISSLSYTLPQIFTHY